MIFYQYKFALLSLLLSVSKLFAQDHSESLIVNDESSNLERENDGDSFAAAANVEVSRIGDHDENITEADLSNLTSVLNTRKFTIPFCEPYAPGSGDTIGIEIINLTTAMQLIASHRNSLPSIPSTTPTILDSTIDNETEFEQQNKGSTENVTIPSRPTNEGPPRGRCIAIYLFARWCSFSAAAAPYISALAKIYSSCCMKFVAVDAAADVSGTTTFFGAGSVPQLIIYRPHRPVVRISPVSTDLAFLVELVNNATGFNVSISNYTYLPDDEDFHDNVLPVMPVREFDPLLIVAWIHTVLALGILAYKFEYARNLVVAIWTYLRGFGHEIHAHLE